MALVERVPGPPRASGLTAVGGVGLAGLLVVLGVGAGPLGVGAGLAVAALAVLLPATHAVALAHVVLLPVVPGAGWPRLAAWAALLLVLVGPARRLDGGARLAAITIVLAGGLWIGASVLSGLAAGAVALLLAGALAAYVLHRYAVVAVRVEPGEASDE